MRTKHFLIVLSSRHCRQLLSEKATLISLPPTSHHIMQMRRLKLRQRRYCQVAVPEMDLVLNLKGRPILDAEVRTRYARHATQFSWDRRCVTLALMCLTLSLLVGLMDSTFPPFRPVRVTTSHAQGEC